MGKKILENRYITELLFGELFYGFCLFVFYPYLAAHANVFFFSFH